MLRIRTCDSVVAILNGQGSAEKMADHRIQEWQEGIKGGDCFRRVTPDGLEIFGEVLRRYRMSDMSNWCECRCYSLVCPLGEVGDVHVSQMDELVARKHFESVRDKLKKAYRSAIRRPNECVLSPV